MDKASHTYEGKQTEKNRNMYLPYGHSYIYKSFKGHNDCFNITSNESGAAVLIRAIEPIEGFEEMKQNRITMNQLLSPKSQINPNNIIIHNVCSGPARISHALNLTREEFDGVDLKSSETVFLEDFEPELIPYTRTDVKSFKFGNFTLAACPRINIDYADDWSEKPLRFCLLERRGFLSYQVK